jgi:hypothetical protein
VRLAVSLIAPLALIALAPARVHADDELGRARQLEAQLEYDAALAIVETILARGGADPARYVELHLFAGRLAAGLDRTALAQDHFARVLALRPDTTLPAGTSPKITEPFALAKARARPLVVDATVSQGVVTLVATDAFGIVTGLAVHVVADGAHADLVERAATRLVVPAGATVTEVAALDAAGNRVWVGAPRLALAPTPIGPTTRERVWIARWPTWAVVTGVALAAGGLAAWRLDVTQGEWDDLRATPMPDFGRLRDLEDRGDRWALVTNLSFGTAAAAGIATLVFALRGSTTTEAVVVAPGPGTAGLSLSATF